MIVVSLGAAVLSLNGYLFFDFSSCLDFNSHLYEVGIILISIMMLRVAVYSLLKP